MKRAIHILLLCMLPHLAQAQSILRQPTPPRFQVITQDANGNFIIEVRDRENLINGQIYNIQNQLYGGNFDVGKRLKVSGMVNYERTIRLIFVDHNQIFALAKKPIGRFSLEPSIHQNATFFTLQYPDHKRESLLLAQPSSFGLFVRTKDAHKRALNAGISAGPALLFEPFPSTTKPTLVGRVNLRLSITF